MMLRLRHIQSVLCLLLLMLRLRHLQLVMCPLLHLLLLFRLWKFSVQRISARPSRRPLTIRRMTMSIQTCLNFFLGMTPEQFDFFLRDESHFFTNPREIAIFLGKTHGKHLFNITVEKWVTTTEMAKVEVMRHINFLAKDTNREIITIDDFMLSDGHNILKETMSPSLLVFVLSTLCFVCVVCFGCERQCPILLVFCASLHCVRLPCGALGVKRLEKTKTKVADTTKALQTSTSKIGHDLKVVPIVQKIEKTLDDFSKSITNVGVAKANDQPDEAIVSNISTSCSGRLLPT